MDNVRVRGYDMISNLPDNMTENILMYLPTLDVVRTSILSKKWRYTWTKVPTLILDENFWEELYLDFPEEGELEGAAKTKLYRILCHFLSHHEGPIKTFCFSGFYWDCPEIGNLISFLSRKGVEDFTFSITAIFYELPSSFFAFKQLRHLDLEACVIDITNKNFGGFRRLITLKLVACRIHSEVLEKFISSCPLEVLCLKYNFNIGEVIHIDAPKLRSFVYDGVQCIIFKNVLLLSSVTMQGTCLYGVNLDMFINNLPLLQKLHVGEPSTDIVPRRLPTTTTLVFLKDVSFCVVPDTGGLSFILSLIGSSPHLKHLSIKFNVCFDISQTNGVLQFLKEQDFSNRMLEELEQLKLQGVNGTRSELEFIKLLLKISTSLKEIVLDSTSSIDEVRKILPEQANVIYVD